VKLLQNLHFRFFLLSAVIALLILGLQVLFPVIIHERIWHIYFFLLILSFLIALLNSALLKAFAENFFHISVLAMILRLVASLLFVGVEVWPGMENIILFIADFFVIFLFYVIFDLYAFRSNLRPISK
jgi:hypothetical protein